jgi:heptosyltransferase-2
MAARVERTSLTNDIERKASGIDHRHTDQARDRHTPGTAFLIGGPDSAARAERLVQSAGNATVNACDLAIMEAGLLQQADLFAGADSGPMNLAAAVGIPAFGLFGPTPVLTHSRFIHAILPDDGGAPMPDQVKRTSAGAVLARIEPYLCAQSAADE